MIESEVEKEPDSKEFHVAIAALGYERRCRWVIGEKKVAARQGYALEFGFLQGGSYPENRAFFEALGYERIPGVQPETPTALSEAIKSACPDTEEPNIFVDISSMSREMIANVMLALKLAAGTRKLRITAAYAPSKYPGHLPAAPIKIACPIKPELAGWSTTPEQPLGAVFGLGCEPNLALGALQVLEPDKTWAFVPLGVDAQYDQARSAANAHLSSIFDVTYFDYLITDPVSTRGKLEAILNSTQGSYRQVIVPFGPKMFAWLALVTVVFANKNGVGIWTFSSREKGAVVDHPAEGPIIWFSCTVAFGG